jgi:hypothetical protein
MIKSEEIGEDFDLVEYASRKSGLSPDKFQNVTIGGKRGVMQKED